MISYVSISPIDKAIPTERQRAKRHYGVHPYFTRRAYNVVAKYILHYTQKGDRVLDPFGGSGVTAIEAFLENRVGIHNDINPFANFIAKGIADLSNGNLITYKQALTALEDRCKNELEKFANMNDQELSQRLKKMNLPPNMPLPRNSDVNNYHDLFFPHQLASLAFLKDEIDSLSDRDAKKGMSLAWSATIAKLNKTFLSAEGRLESRGGSSIFSIYRFKVAKKPVTLPAWATFYERALNIIAAKEEIDKTIELKKRTSGWSGKFELYEKDIHELEKELKEQADYIYTDPPYGGHIAYLDLSTMWNVWLGNMPSLSTREKELIVGGELNLEENVYIEKLSNSIRACINMLKPQRWMSVVFQHWNTAYIEAILKMATESGLELRAAISQIGDPIWSMHKKKAKESILAGEMILTFFRSNKLNKVSKKQSFNVRETVEEILNSFGSKNFYGEYLFNRIVMEAWKAGGISALNISRTIFIDIIKENGWNYDEENHYWIKKNNAGPSLFL